MFGDRIYSVKTSSSSQFSAGIHVNVSQNWRKTAQAIWSYKIQKHFNISSTSNRLENIFSPLTCIEMNLIYYDILKLLPVTTKHF